MKKNVAIVLSSFIFLWFVLFLYLTGYIPLEIIPKNLQSLSQPTSTTELGDSLAILDGIFASIAIVLGLIAILYQGTELRIQGEELKNSAIAQKEQAETLIVQTEQQKTSNAMQTYQQEMANKLSGYTARLQYAQRQEESLLKTIERAYESISRNHSPEKKLLLDSAIAQQKYYSGKSREYDEHIGKLLHSFTMKPDFGVFLINSGMKEVKQNFYDLAIDHLAHNNTGTITTMFNYPFQDKEFAVSLDFHNELFDELVKALPENIRNEVNNWILNESDQVHDFGNPIILAHIEAQPSPVTKGNNGESFSPLKVLKIS